MVSVVSSLSILEGFFFLTHPSHFLFCESRTTAARKLNLSDVIDDSVLENIFREFNISTAVVVPRKEGGNVSQHRHSHAIRHACSILLYASTLEISATNFPRVLQSRLTVIASRLASFSFIYISISLIPREKLREETSLRTKVLRRGRLSLSIM